MRERGPGLLRFAGVLSGDRGTAEDVVQEVLARAARKWSRVVPTAVVLEDFAGADFADAHAERDALARRLDALSPRQRAVLVLRFYEDLPDRQIAEVLGCPVGTVRSHVSRALTALRVDERDPAAACSPARKGSHDGDH